MPEQKARTLHVPMDLNDIFPEFLENRRKEIAAIPGSLERGDFKQIRVWGHNMAGCGEGYGVPAISEIGRAMEAAALASDAASIRLCAAQLAQLVNDVDVVYI